MQREASCCLGRRGASNRTGWAGVPDPDPSRVDSKRSATCRPPLPSGNISPTGTRHIPLSPPPLTIMQTRGPRPCTARRYPGGAAPRPPGPRPPTSPRQISVAQPNQPTTTVLNPTRVTPQATARRKKNPKPSPLARSAPLPEPADNPDPPEPGPTLASPGSPPAASAEPDRTGPELPGPARQRRGTSRAPRGQSPKDLTPVRLTPPTALPPRG
jgi:hypothetical protein